MCEPRVGVGGEVQGCGPGCGACFVEQHKGHDVGWRHVNGRLYTATCHTCDQVYSRVDMDGEEPDDDA